MPVHSNKNILNAAQLLTLKLFTLKTLTLPFFPLYILASFVEDKVSIGSWIYLWAFYSVALIYISVFVQIPYYLDDCGFVVEPEVRQVDSSSSILLSQDYFGYLRFFVFPYKLRNYLF